MKVNYKPRGSSGNKKVPSELLLAPTPTPTQPCEFTPAAASFVLLQLEPFPALLQQRHRAFLRRWTLAEHWPSPLASSILSATPGTLLFSLPTGGEGIVFLFSLHALVATALLTGVGPRVYLGILTPGHRRISERAAERESLTGEHWGPLWKSLDRRRKCFIDCFLNWTEFFPLILLYILFYFSENQTIGSRCSVKHIEQIVLTSFPTAGIIRSGVLDFTRAQMSQLHLQAFAWSMCRWSRSQRNPETDESQGSSDLSQPVKISLLEQRALAHQSSK